MKNNSLEITFLNRLVALCGKENFRPKLDHIRDYLAEDRRAIESQSKVIIVGGTNGKGETCHSLNFLFNLNKKSNCLWTSPHVLSITERFKLNETNISIEELTQLLDLYEDDIKSLGLSFYEALFVLFIKYARASKVEYIILEVGLGGRFDATNIFSRPIAAITSIGLDHTQILGSTLKEILFEKYGISRINGQLFSNIEQQFLCDILQNWCDRDFVDLKTVSTKETAIYYERNRQMAKALYEKATGVNVDISNLSWPVTLGRRDEMQAGRYKFLFVGAHNQLGHKELLKSLNDCNASETYDVLISFSTGREDQIGTTLKLYKSYPCIIKSTNVLCFDHERAMSKYEIEQNLNTRTNVYQMHKFLDTILSTNDKIEDNKDSKYIRDIDAVLKADKILVVGSYYFIANVQKYLLSLSK